MKKSDLIKQCPIVELENCPYEVHEMKIGIAEQLPLFGMSFKAVYDCRDIYEYRGLYVTFTRQ